MARARHAGHVCQPSAWRRLRASAALRMLGAVPPPATKRSTQEAANSGTRARSTGKASAQAARPSARSSRARVVAQARTYSGVADGRAQHKRRAVGTGFAHIGSDAALVFNAVNHHIAALPGTVPIGDDVEVVKKRKETLGRREGRGRAVQGTMLAGRGPAGLLARSPRPAKPLGIDRPRGTWTGRHTTCSARTRKRPGTCCRKHFARPATRLRHQAAYRAMRAREPPMRQYRPEP